MTNKRFEFQSSSSRQSDDRTRQSPAAPEVGIVDTPHFIPLYPRRQTTPGSHGKRLRQLRGLMLLVLFTASCVATLASADVGPDSQESMPAEAPQDTDGDGMSDGFEILHGFDPLKADENMNGVVDGWEDADLDGLGNVAEELAGTDPRKVDTDSDGLADSQELGRGAFGAQQVISTTADSARMVFPADLDGDGDLDVLSASADDNKIAWYENIDGSGHFGAANTITIAADGAQSAIAADLDGDGDLDVLSASHNDNKIAWYENIDGAGNFGPQQVITTSADGAWAIFAADLDGDGDMDVLSASENDDKIAWYENTDGAGNFGLQQVITTAADGARSVYAADLNGDGYIDVLSASQNDDKIAWYENTDGEGNFGTQHVIPTMGTNAVSVHAADLDGDGDVDVLSVHSIFGKIAWYENTDGAASFGPERVITIAAVGSVRVHVADVDGDGDMDTLSASLLDNKIAWYENVDGVGNFGPQRVITMAAEDANSVYTADMDGDGDLDVLSASITDGKIAWYENVSVSNPLLADSDGDGVDDAVDNCVSRANADQRDSNGDGFGNACDADYNQDCTVDNTDLDVLRNSFFASPGDPGWDPDLDLDGDNRINIVDLGIFKSSFLGKPGPSFLNNDCEIGGCSLCGSEQLCRDTFCHPAISQCIEVAATDGQVCSDELFCTLSGTETCQAGFCVGANPCFIDAECIVGVCSEEFTSCHSDRLPPGTPCDDDDICTRTDFCVGEICVGHDPDPDCPGPGPRRPEGQCLVVVGGHCLVSE